MKILIVDDVDYIRKSISKLLENRGVECDMAKNGAEAVEKLKTQKYNLIITDIMMPDMDGFELLDFVRESSNGVSNIPVLAISGGSKTIHPDMALSIINEKADLVLQKPFSKDDLLKALASLVDIEDVEALCANS